MASQAFGGTMCPVRLAGTAIICILAAFGAAFLVARSVHHATPARAATSHGNATRVAATVPARSSTASRANADLVAQFVPQQTALKRKPKPRRPHRKHTAKPVVTSASPVAATTTTTVAPPPTYTHPVYTAPVTTPSSSSTTTHHKKQSSSGGSGTTTIGG